MKTELLRKNPPEKIVKAVKSLVRYRLFALLYNATHFLTNALKQFYISVKNCEITSTHSVLYYRPCQRGGKFSESPFLVFP